MTEAELPDVWVDVPNMLRTGLVRAYSIQTQNDTRYIPATRIDALEDALNRAFDELEMLGVPRERARTVANGINVLMTRISKSESAMLSELEAARAELEGVKIVADQTMNALEKCAAVCAGEAMSKGELIAALEAARATFAARKERT